MSFQRLHRLNHLSRRCHGYVTRRNGLRKASCMAAFPIVNRSSYNHTHNIRLLGTVSAISYKDDCMYDFEYELVNNYYSSHNNNYSNGLNKIQSKCFQFHVKNMCTNNNNNNNNNYSNGVRNVFHIQNNNWKGNGFYNFHSNFRNGSGMGSISSNAAIKYEFLHHYSSHRQMTFQTFQQNRLFSAKTKQVNQSLQNNSNQIQQTRAQQTNNNNNDNNNTNEKDNNNNTNEKENNKNEKNNNTNNAARTDQTESNAKPQTRVERF